MNKKEFLKKLKLELKELPKEEQENALTYYQEYIEDAQDEIVAIEGLGSPEEISEQLKQEYRMKTEATSRKKMPTWLFVLILIFAIPIGIPLLFAFAIVVLSLIFALFIVIFSLLLSGIAIFITSAVSFLVGIATLTKHIPTAFFLSGTALIGVGVGLLLTYTMVKLFPFLYHTIVKIVSKCRKGEHKK